jgi:hypothetical protein
MSASLKQKIAAVFDEPGCDERRQVGEGTQEGLHQAAHTRRRGRRLRLRRRQDRAAAHRRRGPPGARPDRLRRQQLGQPAQRVVGPQLYRTGFTTDITEFDVIYGGEKRLFKAIREIIEKTDPPAVFVYQTCVTAMIGDDIEAVCKRAREVRQAGDPGQRTGLRRPEEPGQQARRRGAAGPRDRHRRARLHHAVRHQHHRRIQPQSASSGRSSRCSTRWACGCCRASRATAATPRWPPPTAPAST